MQFSGLLFFLSLLAAGAFAVETVGLGSIIQKKKENCVLAYTSEVIILNILTRVYIYSTIADY